MATRSLRQGMAPDLVRSTVRVVVLGESGVGKTTLVNNFLCRAHNTYDPTVTEGHHMTLENFNLHITDTGGMSKFDMRTVIADGDAFMLIYSVNCMATFDSIAEIRDELIEQKGADVPIIVVGNHHTENAAGNVCHAIADSIVTIDWGLAYHETSADCDRTRICKVFMELLYHPSIGTMLRKSSGIEWNATVKSFGRLNTDVDVLSVHRGRESRNKHWRRLTKLFTCWSKHH